MPTSAILPSPWGLRIGEHALPIFLAVLGLLPVATRPRSPHCASRASSTSAGATGELREGRVSGIRVLHPAMAKSRRRRDGAAGHRFCNVRQRTDGNNTDAYSDPEDSAKCVADRCQARFSVRYAERVQCP